MRTRRSTISDERQREANHFPDAGKMVVGELVAPTGSDGWIELPIASGIRKFAKVIPGTHGERGIVRYEHELPEHVREHFELNIKDQLYEQKNV